MRTARHSGGQSRQVSRRMIRLRYSYLYSFRAARGVAAGRSVGAQIQNLRGQILHSAVCCEVYCFRVHTSPSNRLAEPARQPPDLDYENGSGTKAAPVL